MMELVYDKPTKEIILANGESDGYEAERIVFSIELFDYYKIIAKHYGWDLKTLLDIDVDLSDYENECMEELYNARF